MIEVEVNGESASVPAGAVVGAVVDRLLPSRAGVAVACNGEVVPRSQWDATALAAGDQIEILSAAQGG